jgi:hypothetical protein
MIPGAAAAQRALGRLTEELTRDYVVALELHSEGGQVLVRRLGHVEGLRVIWTGEIWDSDLVCQVGDWLEAGEPAQTRYC